ncbi:MAG: NADH-quinone oxidoreductase subunit L [Chloroflexi bacterium]|nr:NADH-quinone oxidoreductase subunit L [Chloroflexota bacterium]
MEQVWLLPAIPAALFVVVALFGRLIPRQGDWLVILGMAATLVIGAVVILDFQSFVVGGVFEPGGENHYAFAWAAVGDALAIDFSTHVDAITVVMITVVTVVTLMVMVYSVGYMHGEARYGWYFALLSFFTAAMLLLVVSGNLLQLYLAWEGVGLASYLLIGFYWERQSAAEAAKKAFITTRVGDVGLLIGIILLWRASGTFDIQEIIALAQAGGFDETYLTVAMLFLFAGAAGKSAQFPLHVWLPDAMEGPTPVSALIHAATMVVAGVYLVARMLPVFDTVLVARDVVLYVGLVTALLAATMGLVSNDIKRVLAYSTVSQLGFMFVALGAGSVTAAMFHLFTHAFFKSLLFLGSGSVIHATGRQHVEYLGGLWRKMPVTGWTFLVGGLALAGIAPLAGFWSKDEILYESLAHGSTAVFVTLAATAALTALYTTRLVVLTFFGQPRDQAAYEHAHESPRIMTGPLLVLAVLAAVAGVVAFDGVGELLGFAGGIGYVVFTVKGHAFAFHPDIAATATVSALLAIAVGLVYWWGTAERAARARAWAPEIHRLLVNRYYLDDLYQATIDRVVLGAAGVVAWVDDRIVNRAGVDGGAQGIGYAGLRLKFLQTGRIPNYALAMALGIITLALVAFGTS